MRTSRLLLSVMFGFLVLGLASPVYAQEAAAQAAGSGLVQWSIITAGFALAIAAAGAALGQGKAVASAAEAIARNPGAAGEIRGALILGLVLIESLVIYVLLVSLILFFIKPFGGCKRQSAVESRQLRVFSRQSAVQSAVNKAGPRVRLFSVCRLTADC